MKEKQPKIVAYSLFEMGLETIEALADIGFDSAVLICRLADVNPEPGRFEVHAVRETVRRFLDAGLHPVLNLTWPAPNWMMDDEFAYRRWDGASHLGSTEWESPWTVIANVHHPEVSQSYKTALAAIVEGFEDRITIWVGNGAASEMNAAGRATTDMPTASIDLWCYDQYSQELFREWYGDRPVARTLTEADLHTTLFLGRRSAHWLDEIFSALPSVKTFHVHNNIERGNYIDICAASGLSSLPWFLTETIAKAASRGQHVAVVNSAAYYEHDAPRRLAYSVPSACFGWDTYAGAIGIAMPRTAHLAKADGCIGLVAGPESFLTLDRSIAQQMVKNAARLFSESQEAW